MFGHGMPRCAKLRAVRYKRVCSFISSFTIILQSVVHFCGVLWTDSNFLHWIPCVFQSSLHYSAIISPYVGCLCAVRQAYVLFSSLSSRLASGYTQPSVKWTWDALFSGVKLSHREGDHLPMDFSWRHNLRARNTLPFVSQPLLLISCSRTRSCRALK